VSSARLSAMTVRTECRHYSTRSVGGDVVQRCRLGANESMPFGCPEGCLFFEDRPLGGPVQWSREDDPPPTR